VSRPRALDLFCGAGGAAMGLWRAGFDVVGVDIKPQPHYPFPFIRGDALRPPVRLGDFDLVWASPPCQRYSQCTPRAYRSRHPDLISRTRAMLAGRLAVIENVPSARWLLRNSFKLCGSMFGLRVRRHRYFEAHGFIVLAPDCQHPIEAPVLITGTHRRTYEPRYEYSARECRLAADLHWMTRANMDQAIPPAYSAWIGEYAMLALGHESGAWTR
jgi:DNA (cytosine-5)-methyltransferase 1